MKAYNLSVALHLIPSFCTLENIILETVLLFKIVVGLEGIKSIYLRENSFN